MDDSFTFQTDNDIMLSQLAEQIEKDYLESKDILLSQICVKGEKDDFSNISSNEDITLSQFAEKLESDYYLEQQLDVELAQQPDVDLGNFSVDLDFDRLISILANYADSCENNEITSGCCSSDAANDRFASAVGEKDIKDRIEETVPKNTKKSTKWAQNVFSEWKSERIRKHSDPEDINIPELQFLTVEDVNFWLSRFIMEVRKKDGSYYPPKSLYLLATGVLR